MGQENPARPTMYSCRVDQKYYNQEDLSLALAFRKNPATLPPETSPFYKAVLATWYQARDFPPISETEIHEQVIWENPRISSPRHFLDMDRWKSWIEAGVHTINDICHERENRLLGHEEIREKYHIRCNFLEALTIRSSIPHEWRAKLLLTFKNRSP